MAKTTWVLCDQAGVPVTEITNAAQRSFIGRRNRGRQGILTLSHYDLEASRLLDLLPKGVPQLRYYRDGALRLSAYLTSIEQRLAEGEGDEDSFVATFKDPFGRLFGDGSETGPVFPTALRLTGDQGAIGWVLILFANQEGETGIRQGLVYGTAVRTREYEAGKHLGDALVQLTEVEGGFDMEFLPLDPTEEPDGKLAEFTVYPSQGTDRDDLLWGFGRGTMANVLDVTRQITPPVNVVRLATSEGLVSVQTDPASIAVYGRWPVSASEPNDVSVQETLDTKARAFLRPGWTKVVSFTPDPDDGPQPFDDYWLGDTGRFKGRAGAFDEVFRPRVNAVTITEGPDGEETHELELQEVLA